MTDVDYSPSLCQTILNEIVSLLSRYEENMAISYVVIPRSITSCPSAVMGGKVWLLPCMTSMHSVFFQELIGDFA
jgi:hypothetical protein